MFLLSLDLGVTTGWAAFGRPLSSNDQIALHGEIESFDQGLFDLRLLLGEPKYIVAEKPVVIRGQLGDHLAGLIARTESEYGEKLTWVSPSDWKPHPIAKTKLKRGLTVHEKDAIHIGLWFMKTHLQSET